MMMSLLERTITNLFHLIEDDDNNNNDNSCNNKKDVTTTTTTTNNNTTVTSTSTSTRIKQTSKLELLFEEGMSEIFLPSNITIQPSYIEENKEQQNPSLNFCYRTTCTSVPKRTCWRRSSSNPFNVIESTSSCCSSIIIPTKEILLSNTGSSNHTKLFSKDDPSMNEIHNISLDTTNDDDDNDDENRRLIGETFQSNNSSLQGNIGKNSYDFQFDDDDDDEKYNNNNENNNNVHNNCVSIVTITDTHVDVVDDIDIDDDDDVDTYGTKDPLLVIDSIPIIGSPFPKTLERMQRLCAQEEQQTRDNKAAVTLSEKKLKSKSKSTTPTITSNSNNRNKNNNNNDNDDDCSDSASSFSFDKELEAQLVARFSTNNLSQRKSDYRLTCLTAAKMDLVQQSQKQQQQQQQKQKQHQHRTQDSDRQQKEQQKQKQRHRKQESRDSLTSSTFANTYKRCLSIPSEIYIIG